MAAKKSRGREITVVGILILEDGTPVPMDEATPEQIEHFRERATARLSAVMSAYYTHHPEEYLKLGRTKDNGDV